VLDAYVSAHGGASTITAAVGPAKATMRRLGSFLVDVARLGFEEALRQNGLENLIGQGSEAVLLGIADLVCVEGATLDEADARYAAIEVFNKMLDEATTEEELAFLIENKATGEGVEELFEQFVIQFVYGKMIRELGERIEGAPVDVSTKRAHSQEILYYIASRVKLEMVKRGDIAELDFNGKEGEEIVNQVVQGAYEVFVL